MTKAVPVLRSLPAAVPTAGAGDPDTHRRTAPAVSDTPTVPPKTVKVGDPDILHREAGPKDGPVVLFHFARRFEQTTGLPPHQFVAHRRVERAKQLVTAGRLSLARVAVEVGFGDHGQPTRY